MSETKIISYVGFAVKMNKAIFGLESIRRYKGVVPVVIYDETLGGDALKRINSLAQRSDTALIKLSGELSVIFKREKLKLIGVLDKSLSQAILKAYSED